MADRIIVDFHALDRISDRLNAAGRELDQAMSQLARLRVTRDAGADVRISGCVTSLRLTGTTVNAETVSAAVASYKSVVGNVSWYAGKLGSAVQSVSDLFETTERNLSGKKLDTGESAPAGEGTESASSDATFDYDWKDFIKSFGNVGKVFGIFEKISKATTWNEWTSVGLSAGQTISKIAKDYKNYTKIGRAIGSNNAMANFWKKKFGFRTVGHASTASSPTARFYNNLHNTTSPYNLSDAFAPLTGKKGIGTTAAAWAGVALTGISNAFSNLEEQKASNGTMSNGRVVAETISETVIDTAATYGGTAIVGAAITAATGVVAAPVVVAVATGVAIAGINTGVKALTGKSATEWVSDAILDTATAVGNTVANGAKAVAGWFSKWSFV